MASRNPVAALDHRNALGPQYSFSFAAGDVSRLGPDLPVSRSRHGRLESQTGSASHVISRRHELPAEGQRRQQQRLRE